MTYHWLDIFKSTPTYHLTDRWEKGSKDVHIHSVKADFPIAIGFIGQDQGQIEVQSQGSILLAGAVRNLEGSINLTTAGSILQVTDGAVITGQNVSLNAGTGIGDDLKSVAVELRENGALSALADRGDVNIYGVKGDLRVGSVEARYGNVTVNADGDIVQAAAGNAPVISGNRISLISRSGGIGTAAQPLNIKVGDTDLSGLNASSPGDIWIRQSSGDLRLIRVESLGGDVTLEVAEGSMVDANPEEQRDTRVIEELERLWDEMLLTEETAEDSIAATLKAYRQAKEAEYHQYWRMRNVRPEFDEGGNITGYVYDPYDPNNVDPEYQRLHEQYGSTEFDPGWSYIISEEERQQLTDGAVWTRKELETSISKGILFKQTTSTETRIKEPNVVGRNITLRALNGSVGTDEGEMVIDGSNPDELKDETKRLALAAAEADDVAVDNDSKTITVLLRKAVNVSASGNIDVEAKNNVYLGSRAPIYVKTVESGGSIRIKGADGIYNVSTSGPAAIQGGRTILEGGDSGIGTTETPLTVALREGAELTARAGKDINIYEVLGSLNLAEIYGESNVTLRAKDSILDARGERPFAVMGRSVNLIADQGSVGTASSPLHLAAVSGGQLEVQALNGGVYLTIPTAGLVNLGSVYSGGTLAVEAVAQLCIGGMVTSAGALKLSSAGGLTVDTAAKLAAEGKLVLTGLHVTMVEGSSGEAGDEIEINAEQAAELSHLKGSRVTINSGGAVTQVEDTGITADILSVSSRGQQDLSGYNRVSRLAAANTGSGDITINNAGDLAVEAVVQADGGNIKLVNGGDVEIVGDITTTGQVVVEAAGNIIESATGRITAAVLRTSSIGGQMLLGNNRIQSFAAHNQGGDVILRNVSAGLEIASILQTGGGDIVVQNSGGGIVVTGVVQTGDRVSLVADGPVWQTAEGRIADAAGLTVESVGGQELLELIRCSVSERSMPAEVG